MRKNWFARESMYEPLSSHCQDRTELEKREKSRLFEVNNKSED